MEWDELTPRKSASSLIIGETLEKLGIGELEARIYALEDEINRVKAELMKKKAHNAAAESLFKS